MIGPGPFAPVVVSPIVTTHPFVGIVANAIDVVLMNSIGGNTSGSFAQCPATPNLVTVVIADVPISHDAYMLITLLWCPLRAMLDSTTGLGCILSAVVPVGPVSGRACF